MADPIRVLLVTKGHPYERGPFFEMIDSLGVDVTHVEHPAAQAILRPEHTEPYDVFVFYDMPGYVFDFGVSMETVPPSEAFKSGFMELLETGKGFVFLHHALAAWPDWPEYGEIVGGRFLYQPGPVRGRYFPDSGYLTNVDFDARVVAAHHPICAGVPPRFRMNDELYLAHVFEDAVEPLLRADFDYVDGNFYSADRAVRLGEMNSNKDWSHPPGSNLIGWVKSYRSAPIAYLQNGEAAGSYADPNYRRLLANAIAWAASAPAQAWAKARDTG
ncbi:MAG: ThuA domain-containing protein [Pseudomonadota bacterium]